MTKLHKLTLDTNLLQEYWKKRSKYKVIERLISLSKKGRIDLVVTARIREDIPLSPLAEEIDKLSEVNIAETCSITRLGHWVLGRDMLCNGEMNEYWEQIRQKASKQRGELPDWRDEDHIHAHYLLKRDIFLTWDKGILSLADDLKDKFCIIIMTPEEYLSTIDVRNI